MVVKWPMPGAEDVQHPGDGGEQGGQDVDLHQVARAR